MKVAVETDRMTVRLEWECDSYYEAIELHDRILEGCRKGCIVIEMATTPAKEPQP